MSAGLWYFAYGSNLDQERFSARVGEFEEIRAAHLSGWRLRFSARAQSEGGGGAIIVPAASETVHGAVFRIRQRQIEAMDATEFDPRHAGDAPAVRRPVVVQAGDEPLRAEVYTLLGDEPGRAPSPAYLGHIIRGLRQAGYGDEVIEAVRAVAASEPRDVPAG